MQPSEASKVKHHLILADPGSKLLDEAGSPQGPRLIHPVVVSDSKGGSRVTKGGVSKGESLLGRDKGRGGGRGSQGARRGRWGGSRAAFSEHSWR